MTAEDVAFWGLMFVAACLLWMRVRIALTERREQDQAAWDAWIDSIIRDEETVIVRDLPAGWGDPA